MVPKQLRDVTQWLVSDSSKIPISPKTGHAADVRDRSLYVSYDVATAYAAQYGLDIGFALTPDDPFVVVDLDATDDPVIQARHKQIFDALPTYAELSRSRQGVHIWCLGSLPRGARRDKVEVYPHDRYMICTGLNLRDESLGIVDCQATLEVLFNEISRGSVVGDVELENVEETISD
jgi:primase-polymerase (primpol)-like protein